MNSVIIPVVLNVRSIAGEIGRYFVTGLTLTCSHALAKSCTFSYAHKGNALPKHSEGDPCPRQDCGGTLSPTDYLCDVRLYAGLGRCGCPRWQMHLQPLLNKMTPIERLMVRESDHYLCNHLRAARTFFALEYIDRLNQNQNTEADGQ